MDVEKAKKLIPEKDLLKKAESRKHHSLLESLRTGNAPCIIAEVKKASPSAGLLRADYRPAEMAGIFQKAGAAGISVLTEPRYFLGNEDHFRTVREVVDIPVLRKDFICDVYQVYESAAWGADLVLLIVAALDRSMLMALYQAARKMGLEVLVEAHTEEEVRIALELEGAIIGVNSRNLKTLETDLSVAQKLAKFIPAEMLSIAESGIKSRVDIEELGRAGYKGFLIGEVLMRGNDTPEKLIAFCGCR